MKKTGPPTHPYRAKLLCDNLAAFIERRPLDLEFKIQDWLETLEIAELVHLEDDTRNFYYGSTTPQIPEGDAGHLIDVALMAYVAENCFDVTTEEASNHLNELLIGLGVVACLERLKRLGWVLITERMSILLFNQQPYRVTHKGMTEGFWSDDPMTLWILGTPLDLH